ncbi:HupE/UreJ family protein [Candidatus Gracilibacteria bacterium]|nr:HupE/UreJ family protein [Candidatus Gracilibacteria bacterium]
MKYAVMILVRALLLFGVVLFYTGTLIKAHELIPRELQEYIQKHPNATPDEIQQFAYSQTPEFANRFQNGADILKVVRDSNTSFTDNIYDFFRIGVEHILDGPDHILFVLSLLLVFISWKDILRLTGICKMLIA